MNLIGLETRPVLKVESGPRVQDVVRKKKK